MAVIKVSFGEKYERNLEIWAARQRGETLKAIAERYGITLGRVRMICAKRDNKLRIANRKNS